jgi:DNA-binding FadR family transcriptional regulator
MSERNGDASAGEGRLHSSIVVDRIKHLILTEELRAGDRLPIEPELANMIGVSRGSLREGVRALCAIGLLETRQGAGTYVTALDPRVILEPLGFLAEMPDPEAALEIHTIRRVLEVEAASRAAQRIDEAQLQGLRDILERVAPILGPNPSDAEHQLILEADVEFHHAIALASGNGTLAAMISSLSGRTMRDRLWRAIHSRDAVLHTHDEHRAILHALERREPAHAAVRMSNHLLGVEEYLESHAAEQESIAAS